MGVYVEGDTGKQQQSKKEKRVQLVASMTHTLCMQLNVNR
jgi:hypothetical protein